MHLDREIVRDIVPRGLPPSDLLDRERALELEIGRPQLREDFLIRSAYWCAALQTAFERSGLWLRVRGYEFATYGFVDVVGDLRFGITIHSRPVDDDRYEGYIEDIEVAGQTFPVVISRQGRGRDHSCRYPPLHPSIGTTACFAAERTVGNVDDPNLLLTAGHLLAGTVPGDIVKLTHGQLSSTDYDGLVSKFAPPRVDAGLIEVVTQPCCSPLGDEIDVRSIAAPGMSVRFMGQSSGKVSSIIKDVGNPRISVDRNYNNVEFLLFLDDSGSAGDSGALVVVDDDSHDAIGLYLGEADDINGKDTFGRCQLMRQIQLSLDIDLVK